MRAEGHAPTVYTYIRIIAACGHLDQPHAALRLLEEIMESGDPLNMDPRIHNAVIRCVVRHQRLLCRAATELVLLSLSSMGRAAHTG